jgi:hypothetical protein
MTQSQFGSLRLPALLKPSHWPPAPEARTSSTSQQHEEDIT